jgi:MFS family permease
MVDDDGDGLWSPARRGLVVGLLLAVTLVAFESMAVATIMPKVEDDLGDLALYGWVFSGFFLGSLLGITVAGQLADRRGLFVPFAGGLVLFTVGLVVGGSATSMAVLVVGRVLQGFGAGAVPATAYAAIGRGIPARHRPKMFATMSTAWVVPGLLGPQLAALVERVWTWRVVFLGLLPLVVAAALITVPALRRLDRAVPGSGDPLDRGRILRVLALVAGVGAVFATTDLGVAVAVVVGVAGVLVAVWAFKDLQPDGTLRLAPGVPATVGVRGLLTMAFFSADAYVTLALTGGRGVSAFVAGTAMTIGAVFWTIGSWTQARLLARTGPRRLVMAGGVSIAVGIALFAVLVDSSVPVALPVATWGIAAFGMGLAVAPLSVTVLGAARSGEEGAASSALQLSDTLGTAVGTGVGGAIVALGDGRGWPVSTSTSWVFATSVAFAIVLTLATRRLPEDTLGVGPQT